MPSISELSDRSRDIFRHIVESYMTTGAPVGSRTLSRQLETPLSPATIRNVMADLEDLGYLQAQHASAGRFPTEAGLKMFVSGLLEVGRITSDERAQLDALGQQKGRSVDSMLDDAVKALSGLSRCAGLVVAPQLDAEIKHVEFVALGNGQALAVIGKLKTACWICHRDCRHPFCRKPVTF
jgi:heat-inducible transcriptional repressor